MLERLKILGPVVNPSSTSCQNFPKLQHGGVTADGAPGLLGGYSSVLKIWRGVGAEFLGKGHLGGKNN